MENKEQFIKENFKFIRDEFSKANIEDLSDSDFLKVNEIFKKVTEEENNIGLNCRVVLTRDTLENFKEAQEKYWREKGSFEEIDKETLFFKNFQPVKGQERKNCLVIDIGEKRVSLDWEV